MRVKTSVTLDDETLAAIDRVSGETMSRSRLIEQAILEFLERRRRDEREARDLAIINQEADALNDEMADVLDYQANP